MGEDSGWIKAHRKILDNELYRHDPTAWRVFFHMLLLADRKTGQVKIAHSTMVKALKIPKSTLSRAIGRLRDAKMLEFRRNNPRTDGATLVQPQTEQHYTTYTICKWSDFQGKAEQPTEPKRNSNGTPTEHIQEVRSINTSINTLGDVPDGERFSAEAREDMAFWESHISEVTRNRVFHKNALVRLRKAHGKDRLHKMIRLAEAAHGEKYAPKDAKCNSPTELEKKWDALAIWGKGHFKRRESDNQPI